MPSSAEVAPSSSTKPQQETKGAKGPYIMDFFSTRWLPNAPPRLMRVLEGWGYDSLPNLTGKVFIVTGGTSGIGQEASCQLAKAGGHVIVASPDAERAEAALDEMHRATPDMKGKLEWRRLDLSSLNSIRSFADEFLVSEMPLSGLVCNAALQMREEDKTYDGMEESYGTNFVGHFYLAHLLLGRLGQHVPSRLVFMSSIEEQNGKIPWEDPLALNPPPKSDFYSTSKLANLMVGLEMARRLHGTQLDVFVVHPGIAQTDIFHRFSVKKYPAGSLWRLGIQSMFGQNAYRGALPLVYAAAAPSLQGKGGMFIGPRYWSIMTFHAYSFSSLTPKNYEGRDPHARYRLYEQTADALEGMLRAPLPNRLRGIVLSHPGHPTEKKGVLKEGREKATMMRSEQ